MAAVTAAAVWATASRPMIDGEIVSGTDPQPIADDMLARFGERFGDAFAPVARYEGGA